MKHIKPFSLYEADLTSVNNLATSKDPLLVNLNGKISFNVDGILACINNKKIWEYPVMSPRHMTMMDPKNYTHSFLYHGLSSMIKHSNDEGDGWYNAEWKQMFGKEEGTQRVDTLFYDEFLFLVAEDLIKFDSYESLTDEDIWRNVGVDISKKDYTEHPELKILYDAKNIKQLKDAYRKLVKEWHPDKKGDNELIKHITVAFLKLRKEFKL